MQAPHLIIYKPLLTGQMCSVLDRAGVESVIEQGSSADHHSYSTDASSPSTSDTDGYVSKTKHLRTKAKEIMHIHSVRPEVDQPLNVVTLAPAPKAAINHARLDKQSPQEGHHGPKDLLRKPLGTIKSMAQSKGGKEISKNLISKAISHAHEVELIHAQDNVLSAKTEREKILAIQDLEVLRMARQDMFVRWTMDRHVLKIRRLRKEIIPHQDSEEFTVKDNPRRGTMKWKGCGRHVRLLHQVSNLVS